MATSNVWRFVFVLTIIVELFGRCIAESDMRGFEADSWGTEFVFVIPPNNGDVASTEAALDIIGMEKAHNISVKIEYNEVTGSGANVKLSKKTDVVFVVHDAIYEFKNAILDNLQEGMHELADVRIHVSSSEKISLLCHTKDSSGARDYFLIYPIGMGGAYYAFSLPGPAADGTISLFFLPFGATNATRLLGYDVHNVSIVISRQNQVIELEEIMQAGSLWQYTVTGSEPISVWIRDELDNSNVTKSFNTPQPQQRRRFRWETTPAPIIRDPKMLIVASIRKLSGEDYGCHMPTAMIVDQCALLTTPDYHPTQMSFGKFELITAPTRFCTPEPVLVNTSLTQSKPLQINWLETARPIEMVDESKEHTFITSSTTTIMNIVNYGQGPGGYIHEIPAFSQWANGDTAVIIPKLPNVTAKAIIIADDYGREVVFEHLEYPVFETVQDVNAEIGLYVYVRPLEGGVYRLGIDQDLGGRYLTIVSGQINKSSFGYVASTNLHKIPPPVFVQPSTTTGNWTTTETSSTTTPIVVSTTTTATTTEGASLAALSTNLFGICIFLVLFDDSDNRSVV